MKAGGAMMGQDEARTGGAAPGTPQTDESAIGLVSPVKPTGTRLWSCDWRTQEPQHVLRAKVTRREAQAGR